MLLRTVFTMFFFVFYNCLGKYIDGQLSVVSNSGRVPSLYKGDRIKNRE